MGKKKNIHRVRFGTVGRRLTLAFSAIAIVNLIFDVVASEFADGILRHLIITFTVIFPIIMSFLLSKQITKPLKKMYLTLNELSLWHLDARSNIRKSDDFGLMSSMLDSFAEDIKNNVLGVISNISEGNISMNVQPKDSGDMMTPELQKIISTMRSLSHDTERLINAAASGNLDERCSTSSYQGSWKFLIEGMNTLLDKISLPLNEVMDITRNLAVKDYTKSVENQYEGIFGELASDINSVRDSLLVIQDAAIRVSKGDTSLLEPIKKIGKKSENDYMTPCIIKLMETIQNLIEETNRITSEIAKGDIKGTRGDESKFEGGYREIVSGINNALDTIVKPIDETTNVLNALAVNDLDAVPDSNVMIGDFKKLGDSIAQVQENLARIQKYSIQISNGDISGLEFLENMGKLSETDKLTPAFTKMMQSISDLITETTALANAALEGRLEYRSDTSKFDGEFANILKSFNNAYHNMAKPINEISNVMEQISSGNVQARVSGSYNGAFGRLAESVNNTAGTIKYISGQISFVLSNIASGNLNLERVESYEGDFESISDSLNNIIDSLNEFMSNIRVAADQVASSAKQVSSGTQNLSRGAAEQASSVEQLTTSISEISSQTRKNADNANQANELAKTAKENAVLGNNHMNEMLNAMNDINESSANISKIIKVIDDIAFQTNLLSLNAAVEAARAGQYGKGFAVVAEEVRNLAARSANAAKDTTALIEGSVKKIESGTEIANETAAALSKIVNDIDKVSGLVSEIAVASNEQATNISQVDKGVEVVSDVVQTNSATAEEGAAASEELSSQAEYLDEMLSKFTLRHKD